MDRPKSTMDRLLELQRERYGTAMPRLVADDHKCVVCGDEFDNTQSNYRSIWSDKHDNLVCVSCYESTVGCCIDGCEWCSDQFLAEIGGGDSE